MRLLKTDYNPEQVRFHRRPQKPLLLLQDFLRRKQRVMEVSFTRYEYKDAASCRSTFAKAIKYYGLDDQVAVRISGTKVYLIRLSSQQKEEDDESER